MLDSINSLRKKLIDLSNRNKLINYRLDARCPRHIDIVHSTISDLWNQFTGCEDQKLLYLPESKVVGVQDEMMHKSLPSEIAKQHGIDPTLELPGIVGTSKRKLNHLQTLLPFDSFRRLLSTICDNARLASEEKGFNSLFVVFGFLEWQESNNSDSFLTSPLLLLPVELEPFKPQTAAEGCIIRGFEDVSDSKVVNPSLKLKLRNDYGFDLPEWSDGKDTPSSYFQRLEEVMIEVYPKWRISPRVLLGNFAFPKLGVVSK